MAKTVLDKFKNAHKDGELITNECFLYEGVLLITEEGLSAFFGVTVRQILNLKKAGMQIHRTTVKGAKVYDLVYVVKWWENHKSKVLPSQFIPPTTSEKRPIEDENEGELDRKLKIEKVKIERIKHKELTGKLIPAEDIDKVLAEIGAVHIAQYRGDLKLLPMLLDKKPKHQIAKLLDEHYKTRIEDMFKLTHIKGKILTIHDRFIDGE